MGWLTRLLAPKQAAERQAEAEREIAVMDSRLAEAEQAVSAAQTQLKRLEARVQLAKLMQDSR